MADKTQGLVNDSGDPLDVLEEVALALADIRTAARKLMARSDMARSDAERADGFYYLGRVEGRLMVLADRLALKW